MVFTLYYKTLKASFILARSYTYFRDPLPGSSLAFIWRVLFLNEGRSSGSLRSPPGTAQLLPAKTAWVFLFILGRNCSDLMGSFGEHPFMVLHPFRSGSHTAQSREEPPWDDCSAESLEDSELGSLSELSMSSWVWGCGIVNTANDLPLYKA